MLSSTYGEAAPSERTCREWFQRFKSGDFDVEDRHGGGKERIFEDSELEALLAEDSCQAQELLVESLGVSTSHFETPQSHGNDSEARGNRVPYELKPRDVERRFFACDQLL